MIIIEFLEDCPTLKAKKGDIMQLPEFKGLLAINRGRARMYDSKKAAELQKKIIARKQEAKEKKVKNLKNK